MSYYHMPNGTEVIDVTRYLTSNGGQAVQYIARSTRLDGNTKATTVVGKIEDINKAIDFLLDEKTRLLDLRDADKQNLEMERMVGFD